MKRFGFVGGVLVLALFSAMVVREVIEDDRDPLVIVHWSNSHPMHDGLLPRMAEDFNQQNHKTASGQQIEVVVVKCDSAPQTDDLLSRLDGTGSAEDGCKASDGAPAPDPTIVTPQSSDWLVDVNHRAGLNVVDLAITKNIAETWLGIVTYRDMATCLGWPDEKIGYQDIIDLSESPDGWGSAPGCDAPVEWGTSPLVAFTNPSTSTSGRNVLVSLYSMAADKLPADLTVADVKNPQVLDVVKRFQNLVYHYMPTTTALNTKIAQGRKFGQFFLMPEDNLVSLYKGESDYNAPDGTTQTLDPVRDLVMIYPEEGSVLNANPAGIVQASWVTTDQSEAAAQWIDYVRDDRQQRTFSQSGFRPATGTDVTVDERQFEEWGLDAAPPPKQLEPGDLKPEVLDQIIGSWGSVKDPAIVTFVVDVSQSMEDDQKLEHVKEGLGRLLDAMADPKTANDNDQVGLVTFSSDVSVVQAPAPVQRVKRDLYKDIQQMEPYGSTALYDAVAEGIRITDSAPGDENATRAVIVLSDGKATAGTKCLDKLVVLSPVEEEGTTVTYCGIGNQTYIDVKEAKGALDGDNHPVLLDDVVGVRLANATTNNVQVFFVGFGDADVNIGRILAGATHAEYRGITDEDLAAVIEALSDYF